MTFSPLSDSAVAALAEGARIIVNPTWLAACGMSSLEGESFIVTQVRDFGSRGVMVDVLDLNQRPWTVWSLRGLALDVPEVVAPVAKPAAVRRYRGKYPTRIRSVASLTGRPGVLHVETNDGRQFEVRARRSGVASAPRLGDDVAAMQSQPEGRWSIRPFRQSFSRAVAMLARAAGGSDIDTTPADLKLDARTLAAAALIYGRNVNGGPRANDHYEASVALLALANEGGDWFAICRDAARLLGGSSRRRVRAMRRRRVRAMRRRHAASDVAKLYRLERLVRLSQAAQSVINGHAPDHAYRSCDAAHCLSEARQTLARIGRAQGDRTFESRLLNWTNIRSRHLLPSTGLGTVYRRRAADGSRRTFVLTLCTDDSAEAPWIQTDCCGDIREVGRGRQKAPGEVLISSGDSGGTVYAYDVASTTKRARTDWGLGPQDMARLSAQLGRKPTLKQVTAEAVRLDLERCRDWLRDDWRYCGIVLLDVTGRANETSGLEMARDAAEALDCGSRLRRGTVAASLWGVESDCGPEYFEELAGDLVREAILA